jgi:hypothetical protein
VSRGLLDVVRGSVRLAEAESSVDAAVLRSLRNVGEAAELDYIGVALLDGASSQFEFRYEWSADGEGSEGARCAPRHGPRERALRAHAVRPYRARARRHSTKSAPRR